MTISVNAGNSTVSTTIQQLTPGIEYRFTLHTVVNEFQSETSTTIIQSTGNCLLALDSSNCVIARVSVSKPLSLF